MANPQLKFTYYDAALRGDITRLSLVYAGIPFVDDRIEHSKVAELKSTLPLGQVPVIEVNGNGVKYSQSLAIARYAAKLAGTYLSDPLGALLVGMLVDSFSEIIEPVYDICYVEKDAEIKADKIHKYIEVKLPTTLKMMEGRVQGKFFLGDKVTLADFMLFDFLRDKLSPAFPTFDLAAYPKLSAVVANVQAIPAIAAYLAN